MLGKVPCHKLTSLPTLLSEKSKALVASVDTDGDGLLDGAEFVRLVAGVEVAEEERRRSLRVAFGIELVGTLSESVAKHGQRTSSI